MLFLVPMRSINFNKNYRAKKSKSVKMYDPISASWVRSFEWHFQNYTVNKSIECSYTKLVVSKEFFFFFSSATSTMYK